MSTPLVIIVQCRMASRRFPGKVLQAKLLGQPLLLFLLERLARVQMPHQLVIATPETPDNDPIAALCQRHGYACERPQGVAESDVLGRFWSVAHKYDADEIVRVCGDTPFLDPRVIDDLVAYHRWHALPRPDHTGIAREWGDGQDCEVFSWAALDQAHVEATQLSELEHVTSFIYRRPGRFCLQHFPCSYDLSWMQTSIDTVQDLHLAEAILQKLLYKHGMTFGWREVWETVMRYPLLEQRMRARGALNRAYVEQVASESGDGVQDWTALRYGSMER